VAEPLKANLTSGKLKARDSQIEREKKKKKRKTTQAAKKLLTSLKEKGATWKKSPFTRKEKGGQ